MIDAIKIGPMTYKIVQLGNDSMLGTGKEGRSVLLNGEILYHSLSIRVNASGEESLKLVTIWHEALHGILQQAGHADHPEPLIEALSYGLVSLLRDNPDLIKETVGSDK